MNIFKYTVDGENYRQRWSYRPRCSRSTPYSKDTKAYLGTVRRRRDADIVQCKNNEMKSSKRDLWNSKSTSYALLDVERKPSSLK